MAVGWAGDDSAYKEQEARINQALQSSRAQVKHKYCPNCCSRLIVQNNRYVCLPCKSSSK